MLGLCSKEFFVGMYILFSCGSFSGISLVGIYFTLEIVLLIRDIFSLFFDSDFSRSRNDFHLIGTTNVLVTVVTVSRLTEPDEIGNRARKLFKTIAIKL